MKKLCCSLFSVGLFLSVAPVYAGYTLKAQPITFQVVTLDGKPAYGVPIVYDLHYSKFGPYLNGDGFPMIGSRYFSDEKVSVVTNRDGQVSVEAQKFSSYSPTINQGTLRIFLAGVSGDPRSSDKAIRVFDATYQDVDGKTRGFPISSKDIETGLSDFNRLPSIVKVTLHLTEVQLFDYLHIPNEKRNAAAPCEGAGLVGE